MKLMNSFFIFLIRATRNLQHIVLGPSCCKFPVHCSEFAIMQLQEKALPTALWVISKRILSCNPLYPFFYKP